MVELGKNQMNGIAPLFAEATDTCILSCLQGHMGRAWADNACAPVCARIITGDFCFLGGSSDAPGARELLTDFPQGINFLLMIPPDKGWAALIEQLHPGRHSKFLRYAIKKEGDVFDREKLREFAASLPEGFRFAPIGATLYPLLRGESWSQDFVSNFESGEDYARRGLGFVVLDGDRPVCGASSYTVYDGGIEIEIVTREEYRRQGLARACAARLILACLERGLYPSWDAANLGSVALAKALGYRPGEPYDTYKVDLP